MGGLLAPGFVTEEGFIMCLRRHGDVPGVVIGQKKCSPTWLRCFLEAWGVCLNRPNSIRLFFLVGPGRDLTKTQAYRPAKSDMF